MAQAQTGGHREASEPVAAPFASLDLNENLFRSLFTSAGSGIAILELDGRFVVANPAFLTMLGYSLDALRQRTFLDVTHPDDRDENRRLVEQLFDEGLPSVIFDKRYLSSAGTPVWVHATVSLIRDASGQPLHLATTTENITTAKIASERLRRSERLRQLAGQLALVGGWSVEAATGEVYWSEETFRILEAPEGPEPSLETAYALYPRADRQRIGDAIATCLADGTPFDLDANIRTFTDRLIPVRVMGEAERDNDGNILRVIGAFQDVTELLSAKRHAEAVTERLTETLQRMTDALFLLDLDWNFTYLNRRAEELLRRTREDLVGANVWEQFPEAVDTALFDGYHRAAETDTVVTIDEVFYAPLGTWFTVTAYPSAEGLAVYFRDVSDEHAQREKMRQTIEQLARSDEIRTAFLRATSHELRTPLAAIVGLSETLERYDVRLDDEQRVLLIERLSVNADRLAQLINDLLDIDRLSSGLVTATPTHHDLKALIERMLDEIDVAGHTVFTDLEPVGAEIDGPKIERVVINLVANSVRHTPRSATITVRLRREGSDALIEVIDDGPGLDPNYLDLIFEPFVQGPERHQAAQPGTGLGLTLSRQFVELHGGQLTAQLREPSGTCFTVRLPVKTAIASPDTSPGASEAARPSPT